MDAALWQWLPTPKHNTYSHTLHQQLWTNIPQWIRDLHLSPLIIDQSVIHQHLQLICDSVDVIRIVLIEQCVDPNL